MRSILVKGSWGSNKHCVQVSVGVVHKEHVAWVTSSNISLVEYWLVTPVTM